MNPVISIQDRAFRHVDAVRADVLAGKFADITSPLDGVVYPAIQKELPPEALVEFADGIAFLMGRRPTVKAAFARATYAGLVATNKIHSDLIMGTYAAHVYLSHEWPDGAGTSFWSNKHVGMRHRPEIDPEIIRPNEPADWERYLSVQAKYNRILIHRGDAWHLAEPVGGWGKTPEDGRLVLTCFFD